MDDEINDYCEYGHYEEGNLWLPRCSNEMASEEARDAGVERYVTRRFADYDDGIIADDDR